ncbi:3-hydroxyacyl-CoA dehydrogenase [Labrenzia sp. PHM005]|uniref:3-hydroxyacyl-CoA dehydrogenase n=1 Tax=Labrenzia sp. PHM005 TaxID=2590016 RepID=UPI00114044DD|nr:3-hydroxyacyl-CoA dehydrogenase [Labrenzia sp. PHM005]QDG77276.1 3-hydroxyacyl-CoA dehydrogenase [Labrenzia sp. PHM005]
MQQRDETVAIIGFGIIGQSWSISFARAGFKVRVFDPALPEDWYQFLKAALDDLKELGLLEGQEPQAVLSRVSSVPSMQDAVCEAIYVQENTPEVASVKSRVFDELDALCQPDAIIASSTSALLPSQFTENLKGAERCLVAHPLNPPHLIPAVEIVPNPGTSDRAIKKTCELMQAIGQKPIVAKDEVPGFIMNRLQGAILDEAFALVGDGVCTVDDVDRAVRDGLARRWAFMGPFETIDLNAPGGVAGFMDRYGEAYANIGEGRPNRKTWDGLLRDQVVRARRNAISEADLISRQEWRDRQLANISAFFNTDRT